MARLSWRLWPLLAAGLLAAAPLSALADSLPRVTANSNVTGQDKRPAREHSTPFVLTDPNNPQRIFVAEEELRTRSCELHVSHDGGRTWNTAPGNPLPPAFQFCTANSGYIALPMAWAKDGALLLAMYGLRPQDNDVFSGRASIVLSRTTDEGKSWQSTIVRDNRASDPLEGAWQVHMASDTAHNRVFVGWMAFVKMQGKNVRRAEMAISSDGGKTFGSPIDMTGVPAGVSTTNAIVIDRAGPSLAVSPDGVPFLLYYAFTVPSDPKVNKRTAVGLFAATTPDLGKTVQTYLVQKPSDFLGFPELGVAPLKSGGFALVAIFEDLASDPAAAQQQVRDIFVRRSTDGGKSWSDRKRITDDPPGGFFNKYTPQIATAPNGRLDAAWYDFRNDNGALLSDVYYTNSTDGGLNWAPNMRVSDAQSNRHYGNFAHYSDVRGPLGIGATNYGAFVAWDDSRNANALTESQDVYFGAVQLAALPPPSENAWLAYAAAAGLGLAVAALLLLAASMALRRRRAPGAGAAPPTPVREQAPALTR